MGYRLKRIQKGKPLKTTPETDAIFANVKAARAPAAAEAETLEILVDTRAKVNEREYARGGKNADPVGRYGGEGVGPCPPPAARKWIPLGGLMVATGGLALVFGSKETSDFWVDGLRVRWARVSVGCRSIRRLVVYLDNGPNCSGTRAQFLKRMVAFADWSGLEVRLVYDPPYHGKYNPVERCWSSLERKWGGALLTCLDVILGYARRMTWKGRPPTADHLVGDYQDGIWLTKAQ
ncbi:Rhodopirellula transposase [Gemmata obscuriglobus]|uniref:Tc1-like transposase DDE domain-containing protein n=1 Tax=Gemmata obscuriglobus TaxID=114 RepID=A0A2Z3H5H3_9BACT|nr:hypothetical protein [Gemmata obscuriglobus]AWM38806.1 hypothetical protein C1280_18625 [Gemmata obscuriglobus]QEG28214.1 Rhodopirellula transposase [Gemmata obscuriglobus]VTS05964.1 Transposase OS=uncultured archaeon GZfos31B6 GN=GZ31B6_13 PE=4 SV=1: DDE_Tnp_ISAZ013 [Gemmata obscuriglobus UQM 2246]